MPQHALLLPQLQPVEGSHAPEQVEVPQSPPLVVDADVALAALQSSRSEPIPVIGVYYNLYNQMLGDELGLKRERGAVNE